MISFYSEIKTFWNYILKHVNVIIIILFLVDESFLWMIIDSDIIVVNEAAKASESEMWNVLAEYHSQAYILIRDQKQLCSTVKLITKNNNFVSQLQMSFFFWLQFNNIETVMFEKQHHMHSELLKLVSHVSYNEKLQNACSVC